MRRSGLARKRIYERVGIGKETLRRVLYEHYGRRTEESLGRVLGGGLRL